MGEGEIYFDNLVCSEKLLGLTHDIQTWVEVQAV
jgi:hypothetical protein